MVTIRTSHILRFIHIAAEHSETAARSIRTSFVQAFGFYARRILTRPLHRFGNHQIRNSDICPRPIRKGQTSQFGQIREKPGQKKSAFLAKNSDRTVFETVFQNKVELFPTLLCGTVQAMCANKQEKKLRNVLLFVIQTYIIQEKGSVLNGSKNRKCSGSRRT